MFEATRQLLAKNQNEKYNEKNFYDYMRKVREVQQSNSNKFLSCRGSHGFIRTLPIKNTLAVSENEKASYVRAVDASQLRTKQAIFNYNELDKITPHTSKSTITNAQQEFIDKFFKKPDPLPKEKEDGTEKKRSMDVLANLNQMVPADQESMLREAKLNCEKKMRLTWQQQNPGWKRLPARGGLTFEKLIAFDDIGIWNEYIEAPHKILRDYQRGVLVPLGVGSIDVHSREVAEDLRREYEHVEEEAKDPDIEDNDLDDLELAVSSSSSSRPHAGRAIERGRPVVAPVNHQNDVDELDEDAAQFDFHQLQKEGRELGNLIYEMGDGPLNRNDRILKQNAEARLDEIRDEYAKLENDFAKRRRPMEERERRELEDRERRKEQSRYNRWYNIAVPLNEPVNRGSSKNVSLDDLDDRLYERNPDMEEFEEKYEKGDEDKFEYGDHPNLYPKDVSLDDLDDSLYQNEERNPYAEEFEEEYENENGGYGDGPNESEYENENGGYGDGNNPERDPYMEMFEEKYGNEDGDGDNPERDQFLKKFEENQGNGDGRGRDDVYDLYDLIANPDADEAEVDESNELEERLERKQQQLEQEQVEQQAQEQQGPVQDQSSSSSSSVDYQMPQSDEAPDSVEEYKDESDNKSAPVNRNPFINNDGTLSDKFHMLNNAMNDNPDQVTEESIRGTLQNLGATEQMFTEALQKYNEETESKQMQDNEQENKEHSPYDSATGGINKVIPQDAVQGPTKNDFDPEESKAEYNPMMEPSPSPTQMDNQSQSPVRPSRPSVSRPDVYNSPNTGSIIMNKNKKHDILRKINAQFIEEGHAPYENGMRPYDHQTLESNRIVMVNDAFKKMYPTVSVSKNEIRAAFMADYSKYGMGKQTLGKRKATSISPDYQPIGRYFLSLPMLERGVLEIVTSMGRKTPKFPLRPISPQLVHVLTQWTQTGKITGMKELSESDQQLIRSLQPRAGGAAKRIKDRIELLKCMQEEGNDSPEIQAELRQYQK